MHETRTDTLRAAGRVPGRRALALASLLVVAPLVACQAPPDPPNIVVILADTLRADRLGVYGNARHLTPFLDELAARSTVFAHAYAQCSWTAPSVASLFTSRYQSQHGVIAFNSALEMTELTIAEALQGHGYATGGFLANGALTAQLGFGQGFDAYQTYWNQLGADGEKHKPRGDLVETNALQWLDGLPKSPRRPVFLYLHYLEPHTPYSPPQAVIDRVSRRHPAPDAAPATAAMLFARYTNPDEALLRDIEDVYDAEVASLDETLRHLFAELSKRQLLDNAVVVFTSDHGEEFLDHRHLGHGASLYNELIHVPLLISTPGQKERVEVRNPVSLIDVAPTLADLAGVNRPSPFEGRSLRAGGAAAAPRPALSELIVPMGDLRVTPHERAIVLGDRKLIVGVDGTREQYDLAWDPGEKMRAPADPDVNLEAALHALQIQLGTLHAATAPSVSPETAERLKALGYVQ